MSAAEDAQLLLREWRNTSMERTADARLVRSWAIDAQRTMVNLLAERNAAVGSIERLRELKTSKPHLFTRMQWEEIELALGGEA
ncbi:hypothetical protein SEA_PHORBESPHLOWER_39 [Gordonia phage PhorbesPhlower]|nr:hypothetical protein SEA_PHORBESPHLOWER_39 [Gordonia phage PhorbesPhlower]